MFEEISSREVKDFDVFDSFVVILDGDNNISLFEKDKLIFSETLFGKFVKVLLLNANFFLAQRDDNTFLTFERHEDTYQSINNFEGQTLDNLSKEYWIFRSAEWVNYYPVEIKSKFINLFDKSELWSTTKISNASIIDEFVLSIENESLVCYQLKNGLIISKFSLKDNLVPFRAADKTDQADQIQNFIGSANNIIWMGLQSGKLLAFDIKEGQLKYKIGFQESDVTSLDVEVNPSEILPFGQYMQLASQQQLIGLRGKYFMNIDITKATPVRKYFSVGQTMSAVEMNASYRHSAWPVDDQFIYFCDDRQSKIGVFDIASQQVIWNKSLKAEQIGLAQILEMKFSANRWYILSRGSILFIFERK